MNLANTNRAIHANTKKLSKKRAQECKLRAHLYELQARRADVKVGEADLDIGRVGFTIRHSGYFVYPSPSIAIQRYGNSSRKRHRRRHDTLTIHLD